MQEECRGEMQEECSGELGADLKPHAGKPSDERKDGDDACCGSVKPKSVIKLGLFIPPIFNATTLAEEVW